MSKGSDRGLVSNIQRFSLDDGPGIRTTVFLKGCNLGCKWCHNPECMQPEKSLQFNPRQCINCGACAAVCTKCHTFMDGQHIFDRTRCDLCMQCVTHCPANALMVNGKEMTTDEVMDILLRDTQFYRMSCGGVTFSGGEPLLQLPFLLTLLKKCKQAGLHTAVDTAGNVNWHALEAVIPFTNLFLYDIKAISSGIHKKATGVDNEAILSNIQRLSERGCTIWIRVPVIPGINTDVEMEQIAGFLEGLGSVEKVELLPYHRYGIGKYAMLGLTYPLWDCKEPTDAYMAEQKGLFHKMTDRIIIA